MKQISATLIKWSIGAFIASGIFALLGSVVPFEGLSFWFSIMSVMTGILSMVGIIGGVVTKFD